MLSFLCFFLVIALQNAMNLRQTIINGLTPHAATVTVRETLLPSIFLD